MAEKDAEKEIERIYVVPLRQPKIGPSSKAAPRAVKQVRKYLIKHMKVDHDNIWIDDSLNKALWARGKYKIPSKIRVRAVKFEDGIVEVTLPEITEKKSRRELLKEEREKKTPILRREEEAEDMKMEPEGQDYDVIPAADGDVKIKKKKPAKKDTDKDTKDKPAPKKKPTKKEEPTKKPKETTPTKTPAKKETKPTKPKTTEKTKETPPKKKPASTDKKSESK